MPASLSPESLIDRLVEGFDRISSVLRSDLWATATRAGLSPSQAQVLGLLLKRPAGLRPKAIAAELAVSAASMADTLAALVKKGLVEREGDPDDGRAVLVRLTPSGQQLGTEIAPPSARVAAAIKTLEPIAQQELLRTQIALIRQLQAAGAIPLQQMCVSCRHFRAQAHPGRSKPHHCAFIDAAIGNQDLRLACVDHQATDPAAETAAWASLGKAVPVFDPGSTI